MSSCNLKKNVLLKTILNSNSDLKSIAFDYHSLLFVLQKFPSKLETIKMEHFKVKQVLTLIKSPE